MSKSPFRSYKSFDKSRELLRLMFIYGVYTKSELADLFSLSESMIEKDIYWMDKLIGNNINNDEKLQNKSCYSINYKYFEHSQNYLTEAYLAKSSNKNRLPLFFFILHELQRSAEPLSQVEIMDKLASYITVKEKSVKKLLKDMIDWELISKKKSSRKYEYTIVADFFRDFSHSELNDIYHAVTFFSNITSSSVPGRYLKDTLKNYIKYREASLSSYETYYLYRHRSFHPVLDEEMIWKLIPCIYNRTKVELIYKSKIWDEAKTLLVSPIKLIHNNRYGRWYLIGSEDNETLNIYRVDNIINLTPQKAGIDNDYLEELYHHSFTHSWVITPKDNNEKPKQVDMIFNATSSSHFDYLYSKVTREKRWGEMIKINNFRFRLSIEINDVKEIKPWIRGFGPYVEVLPSKEHSLREDLLMDWKEMLKLYESI